MVKISPKFDGLTPEQYIRLGTGKKYYVNTKATEKHSGARIFFANIGLFFKRLGYWIVHRKWETNKSLAQHLITHLKNNSVKAAEANQIHDLFGRVIIGVKDVNQRINLVEQYINLRSPKTAPYKPTLPSKSGKPALPPKLGIPDLANPAAPAIPKEDDGQPGVPLPVPQLANAAANAQEEDDQPGIPLPVPDQANAVEDVDQPVIPLPVPNQANAAEQDQEPVDQMAVGDGSGQGLPMEAEDEEEHNHEASIPLPDHGQLAVKKTELLDVTKIKPSTSSSSSSSSSSSAAADTTPAQDDDNEVAVAAKPVIKQKESDDDDNDAIAVDQAETPPQAVTPPQTPSPKPGSPELLPVAKPVEFKPLQDLNALDPASAQDEQHKLMILLDSPYVTLPPLSAQTLDGYHDSYLSTYKQMIENGAWEPLHKIAGVFAPDTLAYNANEGIVVTNSTHINAAIKAMREAYPNLFTFSILGQKEQILLSHLLQLVLVGEAALKVDGEIPKTPFLVADAALYKTDINAAVQSGEPVKSKVTYLWDYFTELHPASKGLFLDQGEQFAKDVGRGLYIEMDGKLTYVSAGNPFPIAQLRERYLKAMLAHPEQIEAMHNAAHSSQLHTSFREFFVSEDPVREFMSKGLKYAKDYPDSMSNIELLIKGDELSESDKALIQGLSGYDEEQKEKLQSLLKGLLRMKCVEMALYFNQTFLKDLTVQSFAYSNQTGFNAPPKVAARIYRMNDPLLNGMLIDFDVVPKDEPGETDQMKVKTFLNVANLNASTAVGAETAKYKTGVNPLYTAMVLPETLAKYSNETPVVSVKAFVDAMAPIVNDLDKSNVDDLRDEIDHLELAFRTYVDIAKPDKAQMAEIVQQLQLLPALDVVMQKLQGTLTNSINPINSELALEKADMAVSDIRSFSLFLKAQLPTPPANAAASTASTWLGGVYGAWNYLANINEYDIPEVNRVKASKYEALLGTVQASLKGLQQQKDKVGRELNESELKLLEEMDKIDKAVHLARLKPEVYSLQHLTDLRNAFEVDVLHALRSAAAMAESDPAIHKYLARFVYKMCYDLYTKNDMQKPTEDLLKMTTTYAGAESIAKGPLMKKLHDTHHVMENAPNSVTTNFINKAARSAKDAVSFGFSSIAGGNPPQVMNHMRYVIDGNSHETIIIGMGSPTIQPWSVNAKADMDPIFRGHLHYLEFSKQRHLYVSNQDAMSAENQRNQEIMAIQDEPAFANSFYAVTMAKNSPFYKGKGPADKDAFKLELQKQFFEYAVEKSGCYISPKIKAAIPGLEQKSKEMIDAIGEALFKDQQSLSVQEKKVFIEIYYTLLANVLSVGLNARFMNFTCKDGIDRGMGSLGTFLTLWILAANQEKKSEAAKTLQETLLTRAYWARKRTINMERFERYHADMEWLVHFIGKSKENRGAFVNLLRTLIPNLQSSQLDNLPKTHWK